MINTTGIMVFMLFNNSSSEMEIKSNIMPDFAIFGEPSGIEKITIGYKGRLSLKIICNTPSVHASAPWMSKNAIEESDMTMRQYPPHCHEKISLIYSRALNFQKINKGFHFRIPRTKTCYSFFIVFHLVLLLLSFKTSLIIPCYIVFLGK